MLLPPGTDRPTSLLDCESFDWALPGGRNGAATSLAGLKRSGSDALLAAQALARAPCGIADACSPLTLPKPAALSAILGFVCNVLGADACDYFRVGNGEPALAQFFLPAGQRKAAEVSACRGMLVAPLCEHVMRMREMVWFGVSAEQQELLGQAGTSMRKVLAVPCTADEPPGAVAQAGTKIPGVLVIYSSSYIEPSDGIAILVRLVCAAAAAADALPPRQARRRSPMRRLWRPPAAWTRRRRRATRRSPPVPGRRTWGGCCSRRPTRLALTWRSTGACASRTSAARR